MTPDILLAEGRRLARPCVFLRPSGSGPVAAIWHGRDSYEINETGSRCWIKVDASFVPGLPKQISGFLSVYVDEEKFEGGHVEVHTSRSVRPGINLYATEESVLPPIDAIFTLGSASIGEWLAANDWPCSERYNDNFRDHEVVDAYERQWMKEYPLYRSDETYAVLGGWHWPCADDDWHRLVDEQLMVLTVKDSEPWVEAWCLRSGQFKVIQRIT